VKTLHRSVFSPSFGRAVSSLTAFSREIFAHRLRLAPYFADTCATQERDAMFPPIIIMLWVLKNKGASRAATSQGLLLVSSEGGRYHYPE